LSTRERPSALLYPSVDQAACSFKSARPGPATPRLHPYRPLLITTSVMVKVRVVCRIHSASRASDHHPTGVAHNLPRLARKPKLIRPSNSFDDLSRATHPPSTTPPNPCRSPSRRKTPLPSSRPRRYCTHYHHCHHNNPVPFHNPRSLSFYPTRANTAHHRRSSRLSTTTTHQLANHPITSHSPPATSCTSSAAKTTPTGTKLATHSTTLAAWFL